MGTIADNLLALNQTKENFKTAFAEKEVDLTDVPFTEYPNKLEELKENLDTELTEQETMLAKLEADVNALSDKDDTALKILNGTLEEFDNNEFGLTELKSYIFNNNTNLKHIDFTGITKLKERCLYGCENLETIKNLKNISDIGNMAMRYASKNNEFDLETAEFSTISEYACAESGVKRAKIHAEAMTNYCFKSCAKLIDLDFTFIARSNSSLGASIFSDCFYVENFNLNPNSNFLELTSNTFYRLGRSRPNPENNVFLFNLRQSTFQAVRTYVFYQSSYFDIFLPNTCTTIESYAFGKSDHYNVYFTNTTPATLSANAFGSGATNYKIFVPYNNINTYKTATNWVTHVDYIYGWAEENTFEQGATLPTTNAEGLTLTWYSDKELTIPVTSVDNASKIYYCVGV